MKLIYCPNCGDMKKLRMLKLRYCDCGASWGYYLEDDLTAEIGGQAIPVAIANDALRRAIENRPLRGTGSRCMARVLPQVYDTLRCRQRPRDSVQSDAP